jgi:hypothetical protein
MPDEANAADEFGRAAGLLKSKPSHPWVSRDANSVQLR